MQSGRLRLIGAARSDDLKRRRRRNARIDAQRGPGRGRQGDHDRGDGAHHRQLRHLGRRRHAARLHRLERRLGRRRQDLRRRISATSSSARCSSTSAGCASRSPPSRPAPIGLDRQVLQRMISEAAIDEEARKLGLDVSDDALRGMITANPDFQDKSGAFDPQKFAVAAARQRPERAPLRRRAARRTRCASSSSPRSRPASRRRRRWSTAEADYDGQTRSADMFVLPASAAGDIPAPSDDALKAYFNDRKSSYRAPEYRAIDVVALEPETLANPAEVSDADAEAAYARVAGKDPKFGAPEKRDLEQILFPNRGRGRRGGGQDQGRRELRRHRQGAQPQARGRRARPDGQGRDHRPGRGRRRVRPARRRRQRRPHEPVRPGHRPGEEHHAVDGEAVRRGRRRHQAAGSRRPAPATRSRPCTTRSRTCACPASRSPRPPRRRA